MKPWEVIRNRAWGHSRINRVSALMSPESLLLSALHRVRTRKMAICELGRSPHQTPNQPGPWSWTSQTWEQREINVSCLSHPTRWYFRHAAQTEQDTRHFGIFCPSKKKSRPEHETVTFSLEPLLRTKWNSLCDQSSRLKKSLSLSMGSRVTVRILKPNA